MTAFCLNVKMPRSSPGGALPAAPGLLLVLRSLYSMPIRVLLAALALACTCAHAQAPEPAPFRSIENGDFSGFAQMIDAGADLTAKNRLGETLLYVAAEKGEIDMARLLIARGADAKARTPNGESVLHAAAMIESMALMTALIEAGADKDSANNDGETPLNWAAMTGTFLAVKALADAGANLDVQDVRLANTALHAAVSHDDIVMIHYLLSKNVRTDLRNNAGLTALELGKARGRGSVKLFERQDGPRP